MSKLAIQLKYVEMTRVISWEYASSFGIACSFKSPSKSECSILCGPIVTIFEMVRASAIDSGLPPLAHFEALNDVLRWLAIDCRT